MLKGKTNDHDYIIYVAHSDVYVVNGYPYIKWSGRGVHEMTMNGLEG